MTHHTDAERAEFEAWARNQYPSIDLTRDGNDYSKALAKDYWSLWQAARRAPAVQPMTLEQAAASMRATQAQPARIIAASGSCVPAAVEAATYREKWDAELGRAAMRFVDRAGDVHPGIDDADQICREFHEAMSAVIDQMPHVQRMRAAAPKQSACNLSMQPELATYSAPVQLPEPVAYLYHDAPTLEDYIANERAGMPLNSACISVKRMPHYRNETPLYTAPQTKSAAPSPVLLPEPQAEIEVRSMKTYLDLSIHEWRDTLPDGTYNIYTEQQVRQLLAKHGIK